MDGTADPEETTLPGGVASQAMAHLQAGFAAEEELRQPAPQNREPHVETAIVWELSVALLADPPTQLTVIRVDNEEGIVTLTGEVDNSEVRRIAGEIASSHPGVASAINDLRVSSPGMGERAPVISELDEKEETNDHQAFLP